MNWRGFFFRWGEWGSCCFRVDVIAEWVGVTADWKGERWGGDGGGMYEKGDKGCRDGRKTRQVFVVVGSLFVVVFCLFVLVFRLAVVQAWIDHALCNRSHPCSLLSCSLLYVLLLPLGANVAL